MQTDKQSAMIRQLHTTITKLDSMIDNLNNKRFEVNVLDDGTPRNVSQQTAETFLLMKIELETVLQGI